MMGNNGGAINIPLLFHLCLIIKILMQHNKKFQLSKINNFFLSIWVFFHDHSQITGLMGKEERISLTPHYHSQPHHRHLEIDRALTSFVEKEKFFASSNSCTRHCLFKNFCGYTVLGTT